MTMVAAGSPTPRRRASDCAAEASPFPRSSEQARVAENAIYGVGDDRPRGQKLSNNVGHTAELAEQVLLSARRLAGRIMGDTEGQMKEELELFGPDFLGPWPSNADGILDQADRGVQLTHGILARAQYHLQRVERELGEP